MKVPRIAGVDFAYALAMCMVVAFSFSVGLTDGTRVLSTTSYNLWSDTFIGLFFFLNGLTSTLMLASKRIRSSKVFAYLFRKGIVFFLFGVILSFYWPVNFLMSLGLMFLISPILIQVNNGILRFVFISTCLLSTWAIGLSDFADTSSRLDISDNTGLLSDVYHTLTVSGYDKLLPWAVFYIGGLIYGRFDFLNVRRKKIYTVFAWTSIVSGIILQTMGESIFKVDHISNNELIFPYMAHPQYNVLSFMMVGIGLCVVILNSSILFMERMKVKMVIIILQKLGSMKHTFYISHVLIGIIIYHIFEAQGFQNAGVLVAITLIYLSAAIAFLCYWKKQFNLGPVEWFLHLLAGTNEKN